MKSKASRARITLSLSSLFKFINNGTAPVPKPVLATAPTTALVRPLMHARNNVDSLFAPAVEHFYSFELSCDEVTLLDASDTCRCTGEDEVAGFE